MNDPTESAIKRRRHLFDKDFDILGAVKRQVVDSAVAAVLAEIEGIDAETREFMHKACGIAATNAIAQFSTHIESSLRLINFHYESKLRENMLRTPVFTAAPIDPEKYRKD